MTARSNNATVIGASGYVGAALVAALRQRGGHVSTPDHHDAAGFDKAIFEQAHGTIFYCAGLTADYARRPFDTVDAHATLLNRVVRQAKFDRLVYLSSTRLYDSQPGIRADEAAPLRFSPADPRHIYDLSKALGESICLTASQGRASVARLSCVYSAGQGAPGFLPELLRRLAASKTIELDSSTGVVRDYVHLGDVVRGLIAIGDAESTGTFNVASGLNRSNRQLAEIAERRGWSVKFSRETPNENSPVVLIDRLKGLGVTPVDVLTFLDGYLAEVRR